MRVTLRIYQNHDYDLMALHATGALSIGVAARKALIAYYNGEKLSISSKTQRPIPDKLPRSVSFTLYIDDRDAEGIEEWLMGFRPRYRNCGIKNILRGYLDSPCTSLLRDDGWLPPIKPADRDGLHIPRVPRKLKHELPETCECMDVYMDAYSEASVEKLDIESSETQKIHGSIEAIAAKSSIEHNITDGNAGQQYTAIPKTVPKTDAIEYVHIDGTCDMIEDIDDNNDDDDFDPFSDFDRLRER